MSFFLFFRAVSQIVRDNSMQHSINTLLTHVSQFTSLPPLESSRELDIKEEAMILFLCLHCISDNI